MIPFLSEEVTFLDIDNIDARYKVLIYKKLEYIKTKKLDIQERVIKLHHLIKEKKKRHFISIFCGFDALKAAYKNLGHSLNLNLKH